LPCSQHWRHPIRRPNRAPAPAAKDGPRINDEIRNLQIQLIDQNGTNVGTVETAVAVKMAMEAGMDLVEISPNNNPPVCKIMDYGKFKFQAQKKAAEARKKQKTVEIKEIKLRPMIDDHDYDVKMRAMLVLRGRRQGQDHAALSRPRNGAPGNRHQAARQGEGRRG
jgi:translation initiation factor IF-3